MICPPNVSWVGYKIVHVESYNVIKKFARCFDLQYVHRFSPYVTLR